MKFNLNNGLSLLSISMFAIALTNCSPPATPFDVVAAKTEIEALNKNFTDLLSKGDSVGLANMYTEDAKFMGANAPAIIGKKNIQSGLSSFIKSGIAKLELKTLNVWGSADVLTEEGELALYLADGKQIEKGKYLVVWKKEGGQWKLFRDMSNSDLPMPTGK